MALSKPLFGGLRQLSLRLRHRSPAISAVRLLSFASPEEAAAERRRRKRRLRIEPPLNALRHSPVQRQPRAPISNPNAPKPPESVSLLVGPRLNLHNRILTLIRENDLTEASLLVRHSIYSNCRPTIFTCNAVLAALLRQARYADFLVLHRFITQAGLVPNVVTYNLLIGAYCDGRKTDIALDHYKILINDAPCNPSPTTYRILAKALGLSGDIAKVERAIGLKDEMLSRGIGTDPMVYDYLISGLVKIDEPDRALELYSEFKEKLDGSKEDRGPFVVPEEIVRVYGSRMKAYFKKGMEKEAMDCFQEIFEGNDNSRYLIDAVGYNSVLDALSKNGKYDEALQLFDKMMNSHNPPRRLTVNMGSFNVMVDMFCAQGKFSEAIDMFRKMGEKRCVPDTLSFNNLIEQLCGTGMVREAEEIYGEMGGEKGPSPDEFTYVLLIDACFGQSRADDADGYFSKMMEAELRPNVVVFNKVISGMVKAGKIVRAKEVFDLMVEKELKPDEASYDVIVRGLCEGGKLDEALKVVADILREDESLFSSEMKEFVTEALRAEGREEELTRLIEEREKEKEKEREEALAKEAELANSSVGSVEPAIKNVKLPIWELTNPTATSTEVGATKEAELGDDNFPAAEIADGAKASNVVVVTTEEVSVESASGESSEDVKSGDGDSVEKLSA